MGMCQSAEDPLGAAAGEPCPTVFELERIIEEKRGKAARLHVNLVNIEFRRSLFEVYTRGAPDEESGESDGSDVGGSDGEPVDSIVMAGNAAAVIGGGGRKRAEDGKGDDVFVATNKCTGRAYGVREVAVPASRSAHEVDDLWRGFDAQAALDHPNICRLQEVFCSEGRYYVVTDLCSGGDLMARLAAQSRSSYEEAEAADILRKIAGALNHCHSEGVVHGNLRIESCVFEDTGRWADIKIVDAGLQRTPPLRQHSHSFGGSGRSAGVGVGGSHRSARLSSIDLSVSKSSSDSKGLAAWHMPPEVRSRSSACTEAGDMWMLGALAWLVLAGPLPQPGMSQEAARTSIMVGKPSFKGGGWASRSPEAADFVTRLLQKDASRRMTAAEALEHPWLKASTQAPAAGMGMGMGMAAAEGGGGQLPPSVCASLYAFKESCVMRRLGLRLVGRTLEAARLLPAKEAFRLLDPSGKGYITEDALATGLQGWSCPRTNTSQAGADAETAGMAAGGGEKVVHELFEAMDPEGSGRVGFSAFLAACLAGRPADEAGARVAFSWLDRRRKDAINSADMKLFTGQVLSRQDLDDAFADAHDALDVMSLVADAGPIGSAVREMEARKSAASGAAGGFTYAEFYRLLASTPSQDVSGTADDGDDDSDDDDDDDDDEGGRSRRVAEPQLSNGIDSKGHLPPAVCAGPVAAAALEPVPPFAAGYQG
eukprot:g10961.t2